MENFYKGETSTKGQKLQVYANEQNLVTRTQNCQVQLLVEKMEFARTLM